ncbi:hypothetical protein BDZ89DRAFT_1164894 [Hymenopellis radicata]|nr:hypothetical protein BDZ89DRAFT_1164894 [Hymenopellis radicata]
MDFGPVNTSEQEEILASYLRGLRPLLDSDLGWIRNSITQYHEQLSAINDLSARLARQEEAITASLSLHTSALSPIRRLPRDLLISIFYYVSFNTSNSLDYVAEAPWTLGRVCALWRDIVLTAPILWSTVILKPEYDPNSPRIAAEYFRRSGVHPLSIGARFDDDLSGAYGDYPHDVPYSLDVFELLLKQCTRWKVAELHISDSFTNPLMSISRHLPILEELYIATADGFSGVGSFEEEIFPMTILSDLPSCIRIYLKGFFLDEAIELHRIRAPQLKHCCFDLAEASRVTCISQFPSLQELHIYLNPSRDVTSVVPALHEPVRHDVIQYLGTDATVLLRDLTLPGLSQISLQSTSGLSGALRPSALSAFLQRSKCSLMGLTIWIRYSDWDTEGTVCKDMINVPEVQSTSKVLFGFDGEHCEPGLCSRLMQPGILPNLIQLTIILEIPFENVSQEWIDGFIAMLRFRRAERIWEESKIRRIEKLRLCLEPQHMIEKFLDSGLRELVEQGLVLDQAPPTLKWIYWSGPYWFSVT